MIKLKSSWARGIQGGWELQPVTPIRPQISQPANIVDNKCQRAQALGVSHIVSGVPVTELVNVKLDRTIPTFRVSHGKLNINLRLMQSAGEGPTGECPSDAQPGAKKGDHSGCYNSDRVSHQLSNYRAQIWKPGTQGVSLAIKGKEAQLNDYQYIKSKWLFETLTGDACVLHKNYGFIFNSFDKTQICEKWNKFLGNPYKHYNVVFKRVN